MQSLYEWDFYGGKPDLEKITERNIKEFGSGLEEDLKKFIWRLLRGVIKNFTKINEIISATATQWPLDQISFVDRNVLRIAIYELLFETEERIPPKVAINEAIELVKNFSGENSGKFINGVLATVYKMIDPSLIKEDEEKEKNKEENKDNKK